MRKCFFALNISLDGRTDHRLGIPDEELHDFFTDLLGTADAILFGRVTYQLMESYWPVAYQDPQATPSELRFADQINAMPKMVVSSTLQEVSWNNSQLVRGDAVELVRKMKQEDGGNLSIGGVSLIQALMKADLIDEYWLPIHPVIWGQGTRLFEGEIDRAALNLVDIRTFKSGVVVLHYAR